MASDLALPPASAEILEILAFSLASALDHALTLSAALASLFTLASAVSLTLSAFHLILGSALTFTLASALSLFAVSASYLYLI